MNATEVEAKVKAILVDKLGVQEAEIVEATDLRADLGCDSLDAVEIIMECEKEFNISIPDDEAANLNTVLEITTYITKALQPK